MLKKILIRRDKTPVKIETTGKIDYKQDMTDKNKDLSSCKTREEKKQFFKKNKMDGLISSIKGFTDQNKKYLADQDEKRRLKAQAEEEEKNKKHY